MNKLILLFAILIVTLKTNSQEISQIKLNCDKKQSSISYSMSHPLHSWTGICKDLKSVILTDANRTIINHVDVVIKISSFDSKDVNRDFKVIKLTEANIYPDVSFSSNSITQVGDSLAVTGILIFHGQSQTISFVAHKNKINNKLEVTGNFVVKMTQFNIDPPKLMWVPTEDEIPIKFKVVY
ncbi:MAG: YceI family protein [Bacteroidetes bacterium]|nr:YceI family protein [Bacteroidota bacterium]